MNECPKWNGAQDSAPNKDTVANLCTVKEVVPRGDGLDRGPWSNSWAEVCKNKSEAECSRNRFMWKTDAPDIALRNRYEALGPICLEDGPLGLGDSDEGYLLDVEEAFSAIIQEARENRCKRCSRSAKQS